MQDFETVTERLKSAEEAHKREVDEQQRRSNDLQERLVETRAQKEQVHPLYLHICVYVATPTPSLATHMQTFRGRGRRERRGFRSFVNHDV